MKPLLKGLCIGFLLGIPLLAAGIFFYNQMPVISEPEDQERPVEEPVAEAPEPEPEEPAEEAGASEEDAPSGLAALFDGRTWQRPSGFRRRCDVF